MTYRPLNIIPGPQYTSTDQYVVVDPGTFLTTPTASISGSNVVIAINNSALSGNAVSMKVEITAFAA